MLSGGRQTYATSQIQPTKIAVPGPSVRWKSDRSRRVKNRIRLVSARPATMITRTRSHSLIVSAHSRLGSAAA